MRQHLLVVLLLSSYCICHAQEDTTIYRLPEIAAKFNGGDSSLFSFITKNIVYPKECIQAKAQGKVYINCVIEKDGNVSQVTIIKSVHPLLDKEAERVINLLPAFSPAVNYNIAVRSAITIPVVFRIKIAEKPVEKEPDIIEVISVVDTPPQFPGGIKTLSKYINRIFKYPYICVKLNIQGLCKVKFTVNTAGEVTNVSISEGVHYDLDNEAIRVVNLLPDFTPAIKDGSSAPCDMVMSINFTLACTTDDLPFSNEDDFRLKYPGGFDAMLTEIFDNIHYSGNLSGFGINGRSIISFDIDTSGQVKNTNIIKSSFQELEKLTTQAIYALKKFKPGTQNGIKQASRITIPLKYKTITNAFGENELNINEEFYFRRVSNTTEEYSFVDDLPEFEGIEKYLKLPEGEEKNKNKGIVYLRCFISDEGKLINPRVYKGVSTSLEQEAIRAAQKIVNIKPAFALSKPIGCEILLPVNFSNF